MEILKDKTTSICPECFEKLSAMVFEENGQVFLEKNCARHGRFIAVIENDVNLYKRLMHKDTRQERIPFMKLALPVTFKCNLNCHVCYEPAREKEDFSYNELKDLISNFNGNLIKFSGGEPTTLDSLPNLIKEGSAEKGKRCVLVSNGIKLADMRYVKKLKKAGLKEVGLSLHGGFNDYIYEKISGEKLLQKKLSALKNLKKAGIKVTLSVTLVRGVNEEELSKIYRYYLRNTSFITALRIRSLSHVGRHTGNTPFFMSEIIGLISKVTGFTKEELVEPFFQSTYNHATCGFYMDLFACFNYRLEKKGIRKNKILTTSAFVLESLNLFGFKQTIFMIINKLKGFQKIFDARIFLRVWPDKQNIDLGEIQWCPTALPVKGQGLKPFCYGIAIEDKLRHPDSCFVPDS